MKEEARISGVRGSHLREVRSWGDEGQRETELKNNNFKANLRTGCKELLEVGSKNRTVGTTC